MVALGLSGSEAGFPNEPFREHFAAAARDGLHRVAHAGEHAGPESIRSVLEVCGAERIGHGVRAVEDPALVEELRGRRHPAGGLPDLERLPRRRSPTSRATPSTGSRAASTVSVNSDDPPSSTPTSRASTCASHRTFGYGPAELAGLSLAALRHSFLPDAEKALLEADFRRRFAELGRTIFGAPVEPGVP